MTLSPVLYRRLIIVMRVVAVVSIVVAFSMLALYLYSYEQNQTIIVTQYTVEDDEIPAAFDGKRIVQVTDLHSRDFGDELTELVAAQNPDIIAVTGDIIGCIDEDLTVAKRQMAALVKIAPVYYVSGNHEVNTPLRDELWAYLHEIGVYVMESTALEWREGEDVVQLIGVYDKDYGVSLKNELPYLVDNSMYSILLYHRPEYVADAEAEGVDLLLCGHTHGGQIRLPLIGAVYAPNQGFFPQYDVGRFECGDTTMIVCQGLGESASVRILTPPELVVVTLRSAQ